MPITTNAMPPRADGTGFQMDRLETGYAPGPKAMAFMYEGLAHCMPGLVRRLREDGQAPVNGAAGGHPLGNDLGKRLEHRRCVSLAEPGRAPPGRPTN
jgi:hypothetical protein